MFKDFLKLMGYVVQLFSELHYFLICSFSSCNLWRYLIAHIFDYNLLLGMRYIRINVHKYYRESILRCCMLNAVI